MAQQGSFSYKEEGCRWKKKGRMDLHPWGGVDAPGKRGLIKEEPLTFLAEGSKGKRKDCAFIRRGKKKKRKTKFLEEVRFKEKKSPRRGNAENEYED